jgi:hypothetical protein
MSIIMECWSFVARSSDPWTAPEVHGFGLHGNVHGHPRHLDGKEVTTSRIVGRRGNVFVTMSGSEYVLVTVDPRYEKQYPNAPERMLKAVNELPNVAGNANEEGTTRE